MARDVRSVGRTRALTGAVALFLACAAAAAPAPQSIQDYTHLVDMYTTGQANSAVQQLVLWPRDLVSAAVRAFSRDSRSGADATSLLRRATMLHTEIATAAADAGLADFHLDIARRLVDLLDEKKAQSTDVHEFVSRWYEFAPSIYIARANFDRASLLLRMAFSRLPRNATLYLYSGVILELSHGLATPGAARARGLTSPGGPAESVLERAAGEFRRALTADSHLATARLHLGRVHFLQHDSRAQADLEAALADAAAPQTRYLAHLFLGALAERDKRLPDALREYEDARTEGPEYQSAYVAVSRAADALGDVERARAAAAAFVAMEKHDDPWWDYQLGDLNMTALEWLRSAVRDR